MPSKRERGRGRGGGESREIFPRLALCGEMKWR